jgi:glycosyltransferase involved in cell wall biosynthesis
MIVREFPMKISVITVAYNAANTIPDTLASVAAQTYPDIEHIVIDGASTDGTLAIVQRHHNAMTRIVSEPDDGIYDAMNKGIALATGDVIGFLNADDFYAGDGVLAQVAAAFSDPCVDAIYADLAYVDQREPNRMVRYWQSSPYRDGAFEHAWVPPHPTFFVRREIYQRYGGFDTRYRIAADAELMIRLLAVNRIRSLYLPSTLVKMRMGGTTNRSVRNVIRQNREILQALRQHKLTGSWIRFLGHKLWSRSRQYLVHSSA